MSESKSSASFPFEIFRAADAPLLDETSMMSPAEFADPDGPRALAEHPEFSERMGAQQRVTVPFRQEGEGAMSLLFADFRPGFTVWRHSHSLDCLYFIVSGTAILGERTLGPGDGFFVPADQPYTYYAGPEGVRVLEIRNGTEFDMRVLEKSLARNMEKSLDRLDAVGSRGGSSAQEGIQQ